MRLVMVYERSLDGIASVRHAAFARSSEFTDRRGRLVEFDQLHWLGSTGHR